MAKSINLHFLNKESEGLLRQIESDKRFYSRFLDDKGNRFFIFEVRDRKIRKQLEQSAEKMFVDMGVKVGTMVGDIEWQENSIMGASVLRHITLSNITKRNINKNIKTDNQKAPTQSGK